jgi:hypothetical protein
MTTHEQNLILKVADEVRTADRSTVDREAERLIRAEVAAQPNAAYILTQRVIVQDLALQQARARIDELETRLRQAGLATGGPGAPASGAPSAPAQQTGGRSGVGDFLRTAAAAAAGTIGAQLIYDGLRNWAAGHSGSGPGFLGGLGAGGYMPGDAGPGDYRDAGHGDYGPEPEPMDHGGGGDFDTGPVEDEEPAEEGGGADFDNTTDEDFGGGGDWGDDGGGSDDPDGGGGDW